MGPERLGESGETGKFPRPQEVPLQRLGAEAPATPSRTGEGTLFGRAWGMVWAVTLSTSRTEQGPSEKRLYASMKGRHRSAITSLTVSMFMAQLGSSHLRLWESLCPRGSWSQGPLEAPPQQMGFSGLEGLGLARRETDVWADYERSYGGGGSGGRSSSSRLCGHAHQLVCPRVTPPSGHVEELRKTVHRNADHCNKELETRKRK